MIGFEILLNGARLCTAGAGDHGVLTTIVSSVPKREELMLEIGGLSGDVHLTWPVPRSLTVGDEVIVRIVETQQADPAASTQRDDPAAKEAAERRHYEHLKQKYDRP